LRPVLRTVSRLSRTNPGACRQPRRYGGAGHKRADAGGVPGELLSNEVRGDIRRRRTFANGSNPARGILHLRGAALRPRARAYSNTLEDPGVISDPTIGNSQLTYLKTALQRVKSERFNGALILAHHHPAYTAGSSMAGAGRCFRRLTASAMRPE